MKICICGGGNLGHVVAGFVAAQGLHEVSLLTRQPERWSTELTIEAPEETTYIGHLNGIFSDAKHAVSDAQIILLCLPGYAIRDTLLQIKAYLRPDAAVGTVVSSTGFFFQAMDILPTSRVIEASRATLVGKYMGETPKIVNSMCDKAMGGILFIDEAYTLSDGGDMYGKEAIDTLMKRMEDDRGKFVVIAAGYKDKMEEFMMMNAGLASRFTHKLHIDDYDPDELLAIYKHMAQKEQYQFTPEAELKALDKIYKMVLTKTESWGNAREMRNLLDSTIQHLSERVSALPADQVTKETYQIILPEDI